LASKLDDNKETLEVKSSRANFKSGDKTISFELFEPAKSGKYPAIILLYGSGGMAIGGPLFQLAGQALARQGYIVYLPYYFERTGTQFATPAEDLKHFTVWMKTVVDALDYAARQSNVDPTRIGLMGFSLGAFLSLSIATHEPRVKAVVEYFGGLPGFFTRDIKVMPPTLILHGAADKIVSVDEAYALEKLFKSKNLPYEIKIYPDQGHGFSGTASVDALQRTIAFFDKNLKS